MVPNNMFAYLVLKLHLFWDGGSILFENYDQLSHVSSRTEPIYAARVMPHLSDSFPEPAHTAPGVVALAWSAGRESLGQRETHPPTPCTLRPPAVTQAHRH